MVCPQIGTAVLKRDNAYRGRPVSNGCPGSMSHFVSDFDLVVTLWYTRVVRVGPTTIDLCFLTLLEPQSRSGDKPVKFQVVLSPNRTAVLKGLNQLPYFSCRSEPILVS